MAASSFSTFLFLFFNPQIHLALGAVPRPNALDNATRLPVDAGNGFAPRWYQGTPALPAQLLSPNPEYMLGGALSPRQENLCPAGQHSCIEVDSPNTCCDNDRYCYLNEHWEPRCCQLGVKCPDSQCGPNELYCNRTTTALVPAGTTTSAGKPQSDMVVTSVMSRSTYAACCNRACNEASFSCEMAFGGQCCPYNFKCALGNNCIADPTPSTTSISSIIPEIPSGCTISQITCAQTEGGGCCNTGSICTFQSVATASSMAVCAPDPSIFDNGSSSHALSSGAKAGIGVGVALGAAIIIAAVTWLCIRRRKQQRPPTRGTASVAAPEMRRNTTTELAAESGVGDPDAGDSLYNGPTSPYTPRSGFSDGNGSSYPHEYGYIGPDAIDGPYTDREENGHASYNPIHDATPPTAGVTPYHPDHILRPVEMGESEAQEDGDGPRKNELAAHTAEPPTRVEDSTEGRFELMGSLGTPSSLKSDELGHPTEKGSWSPRM
ncbi:hypothetical protein F4808DRAFT_91642 [Astrocystis sublimbata]|nr:hypothetical protein F4808DRAFT_91642 [Astrocystis sublimbata]